MKQKTNFLIAPMLVFSIILLTSLNSFAQNQRRQFVADTGVINLGPNQKLRVIVTPSADNLSLRVRFRRCQYIEQDGIFIVNSTQIGPIMTLLSNQARFFDTYQTPDVSAVRFRIGSNSPNIVVTSQLVDTSTGEITWADEVVVSEQDVWATAN
ncbi:MAG TPA: hypothetical protein VNB22_14375 [Pyrinomonadaceae bacterium]|nr:hypothetical protein [Pyrinomonadaceae bacterium]